MLGGFAGSVYSASAVLTKDLKGAAKVDKSKISIFGDIQIFFYVKFSSKISVFGQFSGILMPMNIPIGRGECPFFWGGAVNFDQNWGSLITSTKYL